MTATRRSAAGNRESIGRFVDSFVKSAIRALVKGKQASLARHATVTPLGIAVSSHVQQADPAELSSPAGRFVSFRYQTSLVCPNPHSAPKVRTLFPAFRTFRGHSQLTKSRRTIGSFTMCSVNCRKSIDMIKKTKTHHTPMNPPENLLMLSSRCRLR